MLQRHSTEHNTLSKHYSLKFKWQSLKNTFIKSKQTNIKFGRYMSTNNCYKTACQRNINPHFSFLMLKGEGDKPTIQELKSCFGFVLYFFPVLHSPVPSLFSSLPFLFRVGRMEARGRNAEEEVWVWLWVQVVSSSVSCKTKIVMSRLFLSLSWSWRVEGAQACLCAC